MTQCALCGLKLFGNRSGDIWATTDDHILPVSEYPELEDVASNIQPAHGWCNSVKNARSMSEFRESDDYPLTNSAFEKMKEDGVIPKTKKIEELK